MEELGKNERPIVSVVIPAYNVEHYLRSCLDSVLQQSVSNIEVICVEDGSVDGTMNVINEYCCKDARVHLISYGVNRGAAYARNRGLEAATGKYVYFLDADDLIQPEMFSKLIACADANETDCIYFNSKLQDEEHLGSMRLSFHLPDIEGRLLMGESFFCICVKNDAYAASVCRQFWSREFLVQHGIKFPEGLLGEDMEFSLKAMLMVKRCMCIDEELHIYRRHGGTALTVLSPQKAISAFKMYCHILMFWEQNNFSEEVNECFDSYMLMRFTLVRQLYIRNKDNISEGDFESGPERYLFRSLLAKENKNKVLYLKQEDFIKLQNASEIIVYGAGNYAVDVVDFLIDNGLSVDALAVTQKHLNTVSINNLPIYEIEELAAEHKNAVIVLGVKAVENRLEIIKELQKRQMVNILTVDKYGGYGLGRK